MTTTVVSTIRASGGDYTTLSAWEAGEQKNLVTADEIAVAECYNDWPSGLNNQLDINGWTADSTRYIKVTVASGHRHTGVPGTGFWIYTTANYFRTITIQVEYTVVEWVEARKSGWYSAILAGNVPNVKISHGIFSKSSAEDLPVRFGVYSPKLCYNNLVIAEGDCHGIMGGGGFGATAAIYNNTVICRASSTWSGINLTSTQDGSGGGLVKNNIVLGFSADYVLPATTMTTEHNATDKANDAGSGLYGKTGSVFGITTSTFDDATNKDYHLASGSALIGAGANLYSVFTTDIDGDTQPSSGAWDIGFDYRMASGPTYTLPLGTGSFSLSGQSVGLRAARKLSLSAGAFTESGIAVGLRASRKLPLGVGSFSLSGQSISLRASRKLPLGTGVFSLTGQAVDLTYTPLSGPTYTLALGTGNFSLSGQTLGLRAARKLGLGTGAFTLSGQPIGLRRQFRMALSPGAFTLAGQNLSLTAHRALALSTGAFTLSGQSVGMTPTVALDLSAATISAIADAVWAHPNALTLQKFLALK